MTAQYLNTCYKKMPGYGRYSAGGTFIASFTDEAQDANDVKGSKAYSYYLGSMSSSNNMMNTNLYKDLYEGIYHCNVFIENVDKVPVLLYQHIVVDGKERHTYYVLIMHGN